MRGVNRRSAAAICILFLVALGVLVHFTALSGWWLNDDPALLVESIRQPAAAVLFDPAEYGHLSRNTFTPLLLLSLKADLLLRGLHPRLFYAHQIAALIAAAILFFLLLRRYVPDLYAAAGAGVFITSWMAIYAARTLMIRHYVEGLLFALGALLAWSYGRRWAVLGAILYLMAMLSKEVYAPIPLLLICQERYAGRRWREIARDLIPPAIAAIIFLAWRWAMIGLIGGYTSLALPGFPSLSHALWEGIAGPAPGWASVVWAICIAVTAVIFLLRNRLAGLAFLIVVAIAVVLPILPLVSRFEPRYSFAFVTFSIAALTVATGLSGQRWAIAIPLLLLVTTTIMAFPQRHAYEEAARRGMEQEGRYVWSQPQDAPALMARSPGWYLESLAWLRQYDHRGASPRFVFSEYAITTGAIDPRHAVAIASSGRAVPVAFTNLFGTPAEWQRMRQLYDPAAPLTIDFSLHHAAAEWNLGPPGGRFVFLTDPGYSAIPLPASGRQRVPEAREKQFFRIVREEPSGRWTVSPTLPVPQEGAVTRWEKKFELQIPRYF